jgi:hypothetical protein
MARAKRENMLGSQWRPDEALKGRRSAGSQMRFSWIFTEKM